MSIKLTVSPSKPSSVFARARRQVLLALAAASFGLAAPAAFAQAAPKEIKVDFAYYSPLSLVVKKNGWLEDEFKADGTEVKWVLSQGSNKALEFLAAGAVDFGSTAGLAALLSRANGNPIKSVYVFSRPEWTALVVPKGSAIKSIADLKGKKVAATKGTDPYLFLLRSLHTQGLKRTDIEHVHLQHADGRAALEQGRVDAWAGLDPLMAGAELDGGARLVYRNVEFNTYGFLNVNEKFLEQNPKVVERVIRAYERARAWAKDNPEKLAQLQAEEAKISLTVAKQQLGRTDFSKSVPGEQHVKALREAAPILREEALVRPNVNLEQVIAELVHGPVALKVASSK
jgi:sulfonate transport system substrate-binding protein